jgi:signal transduction histidine kinase
MIDSLPPPCATGLEVFELVHDALLVVDADTMQLTYANSSAEAAHSLAVAHDARPDAVGDIHDAVVQKLFAVALAVHEIEGRTTDPETAALTDRITDDLDDAIGWLHSLTFALTPRDRRAEIQRVGVGRPAVEPRNS